MTSELMVIITGAVMGALTTVIIYAVTVITIENRRKREERLADIERRVWKNGAQIDQLRRKVERIEAQTKQEEK